MTHRQPSAAGPAPRFRSVSAGSGRPRVTDESPFIVSVQRATRVPGVGYRQGIESGALTAAIRPNESPFLQKPAVIASVEAPLRRGMRRLGLYIALRTFDNAPMPIRGATRGGSQDRYWERRIRSKAFKRDLAAAVAREITGLSAQRVKDVIDARQVRVLIQNWGNRLIDREVVADLIIQGNRRMNRRLRRQRGSLLSVLDPQLVDDIEALMRAGMELSPDLEDFVAHVMQQEFVRRLFTDIIFTAIVSFNQRVNPLFG
ncbi:MAG TPA: hypothetical protein VN812_08655, partial [Candidatus Acidoferrales bacterium]|nr:hypothetical protein [Candidatus Acidoferrales bacterium]